LPFVGGSARFGWASGVTHWNCRESRAVWEPEHVLDWLRDLAAGRPNKWVESLAIDQTKLR
jgi:hypothetical protein